jgi:hypothetical protein
MQDMTTAANGGDTTGKLDTTFEEMLNAIGDSLSDFGSSDDESFWVMGTHTKIVQHRIESFRQKQMRLDELTQLGSGDAANYCCERDMKYGTAELQVPAVVKPQLDTPAATPSPTTVGEHKHTLQIVRGQSEMPSATSQQERSQMRLRSGKPQSHRLIRVLLPGTATNLLPIQDEKPVEPISFYFCIKNH